MITRRLLEQGQPVRIVVRPHSQYQPLVEADAQPVFGDLKDPASLQEACRSVDIVVTTANSAMRGGEDNVETVDRKGNRDLIDAAKAAGVKQFVFVSVMAIPEEFKRIPFMAAKAQTEEYLRASGIPYTIIAPNAWYEVWAAMVVGGPIAQGQPVTLVGEGRRKHAFVSVQDVAAFAVAAVGNPAAVNRRIEIGGPEALSWRDVVATYERVLGRPIPVNSVGIGEPVPGLPPGVEGMLASHNFFDSPVEMSEACNTFGVRLTPLDEFVRKQFAGVTA
jgi:NADH dehydrogenase